VHYWCWEAGVLKSPSAMALAFVLLLTTLGPHAAAPEWDEEFIGPFASWTNVQTAYGAKGDGVADDTAALQRAFNEVGTERHSPVLYVPAGTYKVTSTLQLTSRIHISIIGADPATTTLTWAGDSGGVVVRMTAMAYSKVNRLTFDGSGKAAVLLDQAWDCKSPPFDTGNEYADDVFRDAEIGIRGGNNDCGFAETSVWRSQFRNLTTAGIALKNFNALDLWVWYSRFDGCGVGVTNDPGAGNYHVYNSAFRGSKTSDLYMKNAGGFNIRNNTSIGSKAFFTTQQWFLHPASITLQGNAISTSSVTPIDIGNQGPAAIIDNRIESSNAGPPVKVGYEVIMPSGDALLVGNRFTTSQPFVVKGRSLAIDNTASSRLTIAEPVLPPTPPRRTPTVLDVPAGAGAAAIQQIINSAHRQGQRTVVHLPAANYPIDAPLVVPAEADIQIIGDGALSALNWTGTGVGPVLRIEGPTRVVLRDFRVAGAPGVDGLVIDHADQPGSRVYLNQAQLNGSARANLMADRVDHLVVDARDIGHGTSPGRSVTVVGGPLAAAGTPKTARVNIFSGAACCSQGPTHSLVNGSLLVRDTWYEAGGPIPFVTATGSGRLTVAGVRVAQSASAPAFDFTSFHGRATLLTSGIDARVNVEGNAGGSSLFAAGLLMATDVTAYLTDTSRPMGRVAFQQMRKMSARASSTTMADTGRVTNEWVQQMLEQTRSEQPPVIETLPKDVTDVRLYRVTIAGARVGVLIEP